MAELLECTSVAADKGFLLGARPTLELAFSGHCCVWLKRPFAIDQSWCCVIMGVLTPKTEAMFAQAFGKIDRLPDVEGTVGGLKDVDPSEAWNGRETGDGRKDNGHNFKGPVF